MNFGGIQKISLNDYPGHISTVIFTQGCNFRCPFCHNGDLIPETKHSLLEWDYILKFLNRKRNKIDGLVISGGEPLIHDDLIYFLKDLSFLGLDVKLDTNGSKPDKLKAILAVI